MRTTVALTTEGTYPFASGGVSVWCQQLIENLTKVDFHVISLVPNPFVTFRFAKPNNLTKLSFLPIWGTLDPAEFRDESLFALVARKRLAKKQSAGEAFGWMIDRLFADFDQEGRDVPHFVETLLLWHNHFTRHDYRETFRSPSVWDAFAAAMQERYDGVSVQEVRRAYTLFFRMLLPTTLPIPEEDLIHSTAAAFCAIPGLLAKKSRGTPMILTEHGVYLREQYIFQNREHASPAVKHFVLSLIKTIVRACYEEADIIAPVCQFNKRWEIEYGADPSKIMIIYNGVDEGVFYPASETVDGPHAVTVAVISPLKDIETLMRATIEIRKAVPGYEHHLFGNVMFPDYYRYLLGLRQKLALERNFFFHPHDDRPAAAYYHRGRIFALSSLSEGFPYVVLEAMMCGKPIVATDVGGVAEAVEQCGFVVPPRSPKELGAASVRLLRDEHLQQELSKRARRRAMAQFRLRTAVEAYESLYQKTALLSTP